jgi:malate dehydrogenase (oxaloacetate-decarboxylating)
MKIAAAKSLAELVKEDELTPEYIIPGALDPRVVPAVAESVARAAKESGVAR